MWDAARTHRERVARRRHAVVRRAVAVASAALVGAVLVGCGDDPVTDPDRSSTSSSSSNSQTSSNAPTSSNSPTDEDAARPRRVLVTNDDGIGGAGLDALVSALDALGDVELVVVAPAANQSGTGGNTSSPVPAAVAATTASGRAGFSVAGFPADAVAAAFAMPDADFDLVISGINAGQNLGPAVELSGTVGAARAAARRGVPAIAVSQGITTGVAEPDFEVGVEVLLEWLEVNRGAIPAPTPGTPTVAWSLNVPTCPSGEPGAVVEVPVAAEAGTRDVTTVSCGGAVTNPVDDIDGFVNGAVTLSDVSPVN